MPRFLVVHPVGKEFTMDAAAPIGKAVKAILGRDAYWLRSSYAREEGRLYCEWDAADASSIRRLLSNAAPNLPTDGVYKLELITDAEAFR